LHAERPAASQFNLGQQFETEEQEKQGSRTKLSPSWFSLFENVEMQFATDLRGASGTQHGGHDWTPFVDTPLQPFIFQTYRKRSFGSIRIGFWYSGYSLQPAKADTSRSSSVTL
jgi:hypothetical protein